MEGQPSIQRGSVSLTDTIRLYSQLRMNDDEEFWNAIGWQSREAPPVMFNERRQLPSSSILKTTGERETREENEREGEAEGGERERPSVYVGRTISLTITAQ